MSQAHRIVEHMFDTIEPDRPFEQGRRCESQLPEIAPEDLVDELESLFRQRDRLEARISLVVESRALDVGRKKRLVPEWLRDAVSARDLRCVFPGCDRPSNWCDVHHLKHWADDGKAEINNLVLLCRHHHTLVHEVGWKVTGRPGSLRFWRPSGQELGTPIPRRAVSPITSVEWRAKDCAWVATPLSVSAAVRAIRGP